MASDGLVFPRCISRWVTAASLPPPHSPSVPRPRVPHAHVAAHVGPWTPVAPPGARRRRRRVAGTARARKVAGAPRCARTGCETSHSPAPAPAASLRMKATRRKKWSGELVEIGLFQLSNPSRNSVYRNKIAGIANVACNAGVLLFLLFLEALGEGERGRGRGRREGEGEGGEKERESEGERFSRVVSFHLYSLRIPLFPSHLVFSCFSPMSSE